MLNYKTALFDKDFWNYIYRPIFGCITQAIAILVSVITVHWLSDSPTAFREAVTSIVGLSVLFSILGSVLVNLGTLAISLQSIKAYLFLSPFNSKSRSRDIVGYINDKWVAEFLVSLRLPVGLLIISFVLSLIVYISGENWEAAFLKSILYILPFHMAVFAVYFLNIVIQVVLLHLRLFLALHYTPEER